jgi:hypothetical protein
MQGGFLMSKLTASNILGKSFGKWRVIEYHHTDSHWHKHWVCRCECGTEKIIDGYKLLYGTTNGCHKCNAPHRHRMSHTRLYSIWIGMKGRCYNDKNKSYKSYGGRGIKVCPEWQTFEPFYGWAMANGYTDNLTIERKDVNGDYCPKNCCWIPLNEQTKNTTRNIFITFDGETKILKEWAKEVGVSPDTLKRHIKKYGVEKTLSTRKEKRVC